VNRNLCLGGLVRIVLLLVTAVLLATAGPAEARVKAPKVKAQTVAESAPSVKFTVTLPAKPARAISVSYATRNGTATAGGDYVKAAGKLKFRKGKRTGSVTVKLLNDTTDEISESFSLRLSAVKKKLKAGSATAVILDDDDPPVGGGGSPATGGGPPGPGGPVPAVESCNGVDDDLDGTADDGVCVANVTLAGSGTGTVSSSPGGINCPGVCSASFRPQGTSVTLTATPTGGSTFTGWSGACSGTSTTCTFTSGERSVTATFTPPPGPAAGDIVINEINYDPASAPNGDANGDGLSSATQDEFVEIVNSATGARNLGGVTLSTGAGLKHTVPADTVLKSGCVLVVFGGGTPTGAFGGAVTQVASSGGLGLTPSATVTLRDAGATELASHAYTDTATDESLTRSPDISGTFTPHLTATSNAHRFSPGTQLSGTAFSGCS
jgi:hypothetical protein